MIIGMEIYIAVVISFVIAFLVQYVFCTNVDKRQLKLLPFYILLLWTAVEVLKATCELPLDAFEIYYLEAVPSAFVGSLVAWIAYFAQRKLKKTK